MTDYMLPASPMLFVLLNRFQPVYYLAAFAFQECMYFSRRYLINEGDAYIVSIRGRGVIAKTAT